MYHVTARANRKEKLLASPVAKELFIEILAKYRQRSGCSFLGFTVMDNHVSPRGTVPADKGTVPIAGDFRAFRAVARYFFVTLYEPKLRSLFISFS